MLDYKITVNVLESIIKKEIESVKKEMNRASNKEYFNLCKGEFLAYKHCLNLLQSHFDTIKESK